MNQNSDELERVLRQLGHKIQSIAGRVKRIGSYTLSLELNEIAENIEKICDNALDDLAIGPLDRPGLDSDFDSRPNVQ